MSYVICVMIGVAVLGFGIRSMLSIIYWKIRKEAESMGKSTHPLMKTLMKRFHTSYELKIKIKNVDIYVEKYLRLYKKAGISLAAWEMWGEVLFAVSVLGCIAINAYLIWTNELVQWSNGELWSKMTVFCTTLLPCVVLYIQDIILNLVEQRKRVKVEILDYLENVCQPRLENDMFHKDEMQEYQREYFDKERKQLDQLLQPEQIRFTKEEQQVIEEVLREYMV